MGKESKGKLPEGCVWEFGHGVLYSKNHLRCFVVLSDVSSCFMYYTEVGMCI